MTSINEVIEWRLWQVGQCLRNTKKYPFTEIAFYSKRLKAAIGFRDRANMAGHVRLTPEPNPDR